MHILVTSDTVSNVWAYTRELVTGLVTHGHRVTLVSFGDILLPSEISWMDHLHGLQYRPTAFRLDWMQEGQNDFQDSSAYLVALVRELNPDLLHLNHLGYGSLPVSTPRVVVAHGDLISWWQSVHGQEPKNSRWLRWYREITIEGLTKATVLVAPSVWMLDTVRACYARPGRDMVIYSGRNPIFFNPYTNKEDFILSVGRLWDASKQISLLTQQPHPLPVCIVDSDKPVQPSGLPIRAEVKLAADEVQVALKGAQTESQLRLLYSRAAIYVATSRYEPFAMSTVEAAFSRCAIVANDIPPLREIWGDTALYFRSNDAFSLAAVTQRLSVERELCRSLGNLAFQRARECFTAKRMVEDYLQLYGNLLRSRFSAAA